MINNNLLIDTKTVTPTAIESSKPAVSPRFLKVPTPTSPVSPPSPALPPLVQPSVIKVPTEESSNQSEIYGLETEKGVKGGKPGKPGIFNVVEGCDDPEKTPPSPPSPVSSVALQVTNADFMSALFHTLPQDAYVAVCSKSGDPTTGSWFAKRADQVAGHLSSNHNNYFNISSYYLADGKSIHTKKEHFAALHVLMFDDIGTKIPLIRFKDFQLS